MSNPIFRMEENRANEYVIQDGQVMTVNGTINVALAIGMVMVVAAFYTWSRFSLGYTDIASMLTNAGAIIGLILALIICFTKSSFLVPIYAACEGLFLGGISYKFEALYPGIVSQAIAGTFAALFAMLILYKLKVIQCTEKFRSVIFISTLSIAAVYLIAWIGSLFGYTMPFISSATPAGILISAVITVIAALNLIIDFEFIEVMSERMAPKEYEWYGAFGLMVTLVWLYVEMLRLLAKLQRR